MEIKKETFEKLKHYVMVNNHYDCFDAIASLTEKQANGIVEYIQAKRSVIEVEQRIADEVVLNTVLYDLHGYSSGNDMFVAKTASFQTINFK